MHDVSSKRNLLTHLSELRLPKDRTEGRECGPSLRLVALVACFAISILMWCGLYFLIAAAL